MSSLPVSVTSFTGKRAYPRARPEGGGCLRCSPRAAGSRRHRHSSLPSRDDLDRRRRAGQRAADGPGGAARPLLRARRAEQHPHAALRRLAGPPLRRERAVGASACIRRAPPSPDPIRHLEAGPRPPRPRLPGRQRQRAPGLARLRLPGLALDVPVGPRRHAALGALRRGRLPRDRGGDPGRARRRRGPRPARAGPRPRPRRGRRRESASRARRSSPAAPTTSPGGRASPASRSRSSTPAPAPGRRSTAPGPSSSRSTARRPGRSSSTAPGLYELSGHPEHGMHEVRLDIDGDVRVWSLAFAPGPER